VVRLLAAAPAVGRAAASSPGGHAAASAWDAAEYPVPRGPARDRDPGCRAGAGGVFAAGGPRPRRDRRALCRAGRGRGGRGSRGGGHRHRARRPPRRASAPSRWDARQGPQHAAGRQRPARRGGQADPGCPCIPVLAHRGTHGRAGGRRCRAARKIRSADRQVALCRPHVCWRQFSKAPVCSPAAVAAAGHRTWISEASVSASRSSSVLYMLRPRISWTSCGSTSGTSRFTSFSHT